MSVPLLREVLALKVAVVHPPDEEGDALIGHLHRVGCMASGVWPIPAALPFKADVLFLMIDGESKAAIETLLKSLPQPRPMVIAILNYENPSTLQLVLESGALAVVQKPIKPFGLLASLAIARSVWSDCQALARENRKMRRKISSDQTISRAKTILMASRQLSESEAYEAVREQAMAKRVSMDEIATSIINMENLLKPNRYVEAR